MPFRRHKTALASACRSIHFEGLEPRRLFTTLVGGDSFVYSDAQGNAIRVTLSGNITAELIGSNVDTGNNIGLNELPGRIVAGPRAGTNLNGGFAGGTGIDQGNILPTPVTDNINDQGTLTTDGTNLQALASDASGNTYSFNVSSKLVDALLTPSGAPEGTVPTPVTPSIRTIQLVSMNTGTGAGTTTFSLEGQLTLVAPEQTVTDLSNVPLLISSVTQIAAADFGPDGLLYFVTVDHPSKARQDFGESLGELPTTATPGQNDPNAGTAVELQTPRLWRMNVTTGVVESIPGSFNINTNNRGPFYIRSIAFDSAGNLYGYGVRTSAATVGQAGTVTGVLFNIPLGNTNGVGNFRNVSLDGVNVTNITGIEFIPGDDEHIIAVTSDNPTDPPSSSTQQTAPPPVNPAPDSPTSILAKLPSVLRIDLNGEAQNFGPLSPVGGNVGSDIEGLTWNPTAPNPFTGGTGVLLGTDQDADRLVRIDSRNRFPASDLYTIYVSESDETGSITTAGIGRTIVDVYGDNGSLANLNDAMQPFVDSIGSLRVVNAQGAVDRILVDANDGTGIALLGARTRDRLNVDADEDVPFITAPVAQTFGALPASYTSLTPGLIVADQQDLNKFFWGGTVTGQVDAGGSIETFYGGWILTGATTGNLLGSPTIPNNFRVDGDLRNLISIDTIGSDTAADLGATKYYTGFDLEVGGVIGQISTTDDYLGGFSAANNKQQSLTGAYSEIEVRSAQPSEGGFFESGFLYRGETFWNDTAETPQYLGAVTNARTGGRPGVVVDGSLVRTALVNDFQDYYAVTFTGGQTIQVQVITLGFPPPVHVGVFDPDGVLIATDYSNVGSLTNVEFQITVRKAGTYHFAIATSGDADFTTGGEFAEDPALPVGYELSVTSLGDLAVGALATAGIIYDGQANSAFSVANGDLGLFKAGTQLVGEGRGISISVAGNLRSLRANAIGTQEGTLLGGYYNLNVGGDVGLIRSDTFAVLNEDPSYAGSVRNYQTLQVENVLLAKLYATQGIGTIAAGSMDTLTASQIRVNVDSVGFDGKVDLIDVTGDFGTPAGGPQISTGPGGDVRYIRVGGQAYRDSIFGGGAPDETDYSLGQSITLVDDSGAQITLSPGELIANPLYNPNDPTSTEEQYLNAPQFTNVLTYGIRGSGGSVIISLTTSGSTITATTTATQTSTSVAIGEIIVNSAGRTNEAVDPEATLLPGTGTDTTTPGTGDDLIDPVNIRLTGSARVDVFQLTATNINIFENTTSGEIVNLTATSIGTFTSDGDIGLSRSSTGAEIHPIATVEDTFPFNGQRTHVAVSGDIVSIASRRGIGNVVVGGNIGSLTANADGNDNTAYFEGINAPIMATNFFFVNIGEGIAAAGTGERSEAGLFASNRIVRVVNQGLGSDIRGDIVATGSIGEIALTDGAFINADVLVVSSFDQAREYNGAYIALPDTNPIDAPVNEIEDIHTDGRGGVIGTLFVSTDIAKIRVNDGFGFLNSAVQMLGVGVFGGLDVDGYGIRNVVISGGSSSGNIVANGSGNNISTARFTPSVRRSETQEGYDPFFSVAANRLTDINAFLAVTAQNPIIEGATNTGVIEDIFAAGNRDLGKVKADQIRSTDPLNPSRLNYANSIDAIEVKKNINILRVTTGKLRKFQPGRDVFGTNLTIAGPIDRIGIKGNFAANSSISSVGPNAKIGKIKIKGNLDGSINSNGSVGEVDIGGNLTGGIDISGRGTKLALKDFLVGGSVSQGALVVRGNVGKIEARGGFGVEGDSLTITGNLQRLKVGSSSKFSNPVLGLDLTVNGTLGELSVRGSVTGDILVGKSFKKYLLKRAAGSPAVVSSGDVTVGTKIGTIKITGGSVDGSFVSTQDFGTFSLAGGSVLAGNTFGSTARGIKSLRVTGGDFAANVVAATRVSKFDVRGNLGDGISPVTFNASSVGSFSVGASILNGVTVQIDGKINTLRVGGNVDAGASVTATSIGKRRIDGAVLGFVTA